MQPLDIAAEGTFPAPSRLRATSWEPGMEAVLSLGRVATAVVGCRAKPMFVLSSEEADGGG